MKTHIAVKKRCGDHCASLKITALCSNEKGYMGRLLPRTMQTANKKEEIEDERNLLWAMNGQSVPQVASKCAIKMPSREPPDDRSVRRGSIRFAAG
jgi:hypothetical protein